MHLFKYSKTKNNYIVKCLYTFVLHLNIFHILHFFLWNQSWISEAITPVSHAPSENILICWFDTQETFLIIIINVEDRYTA